MRISNFSALFCSSGSGKDFGCSNIPIHKHLVKDVSLPLSQPSFGPDPPLLQASKTSQHARNDAALQQPRIYALSSTRRREKEFISVVILNGQLQFY